MYIPGNLKTGMHIHSDKPNTCNQSQKTQVSIKQGWNSGHGEELFTSTRKNPKTQTGGCRVNSKIKTHWGNFPEIIFSLDLNSWEITWSSLTSHRLIYLLVWKWKSGEKHIWLILSNFSCIKYFWRKKIYRQLSQNFFSLSDKTGSWFIIHTDEF